MTMDKYGYGGGGFLHRPVGGGGGWQEAMMQQDQDDPEKVGVEALRACQDLQHMIDANSDHLERLRATMTGSSAASGI